MRLVFLVTLISLELGCDKSRTFERNQPFARHEWHKDQSLHFDLNIKDTTSLYDLYVNVRHSARFGSVNLWVDLQTTYPSGDSGSTQLNLELGSNAAERWFGDCVADICDVSVPVATGLSFSEKGLYRFRLRHVMWEDPLERIMSAGLKIEKE